MDNPFGKMPKFRNTEVNFFLPQTVDIFLSSIAYDFTALDDMILITKRLLFSFSLPCFLRFRFSFFLLFSSFPLFLLVFPLLSFFSLFLRFFFSPRLSIPLPLSHIFAFPFLPSPSLLPHFPPIFPLPFLPSPLSVSPPSFSPILSSSIHLSRPHLLLPLAPAPTGRPHPHDTKYYGDEAGSDEHEGSAKKMNRKKINRSIKQKKNTHCMFVTGKNNYKYDIKKNYSLQISNRKKTFITRKK